MPHDTLLVVEDNDVLREGLRDMLIYEGFHVLAACNGQDALECIEGMLPALILSDIAMPVMNGFDLYEAVRQRAEWIAIPFIFLTAKTEPDDVRRGRKLGVDDYLTKPINREELVSTIRSRLARSRQIQVAQLQHAYLASLTALANAADMRDVSTNGHVSRVSNLSMALARHMGWKERQLEIIQYGAILHDIGKIHIPEKILFKPEELTNQEWEVVQRHPVNGERMVKDVDYLAESAPIVRHHHERWDGSGYPDGLSGESIPLGARIVSVADSFDAMTSYQPYSPARSLQDAYMEILSLSGERYDPGVVAAFQRAWYAGEIQSITVRR
ncbi:MAG: HD domain-containing phosphohydrolase [Chloroflexota bacterium]